VSGLPTARPCSPARAHGRLRGVLACAAIALLLALVVAGAGQAAFAPRTSLPAIERQVMCVTCKIPLNVAESPQADRERAFIQSLIAEGKSEGQIKRALVGQYGPAVLALPSSHGFGLAAYSYRCSPGSRCCPTGAAAAPPRPSRSPRPRSTAPTPRGWMPTSPTSTKARRW